MNRVTWFGKPVPLFLIVAGAVISVALSSSRPAVAGSSRECVTAEVDSPFRLPDGRLYPAGPLTLCASATYSPVDTFHRILVGGSPIGLFRSRRRNAETGNMLSPEVVFNRETDGTLDLIGYAVPNSGRGVAYRMSVIPDVWQASARHRLAGAATPIASIVAASGTR